MTWSASGTRGENNAFTHPSVFRNHDSPKQTFKQFETNSSSRRVRKFSLNIMYAFSIKRFLRDRNIYVKIVPYSYVQYFTEAIIELVKVNSFLILRINLENKI